MKRYSAFAAFALVAVLAAPSFAKDLAGLYGLGYVRPEAPVGGRVWLGNAIGLDAGVGFFSTDIELPDDFNSTSAFAIDLGVPLVVHNADNTIFWVRPGFTYATENVEFLDSGSGTTTEFSPSQFWVSGTLGVEHFFGERFSLSAAHGVRFTSFDPDTPGSDTITEFETEAFGVSNIGFHYYFGTAR
jgi:hypothetical protein